MKQEWMTNNPPEEICEYLVTDDCECLQIATWTNEFYLGRKVIGEWHWERQQYTNVVAWMPLPNPYKSSNEVEQEIRAKVIDESTKCFTDWIFERHGLSQVDIREINEIVEQLKKGGAE